MADRLLEFAANERRTKREVTHLSRSDIQSIITRLTGGVAATGHRLLVPGGQRRPLRRAGGGPQAEAPAGLGLEEPKEFYCKVKSWCGAVAILWHT